MKRGGIRTVQAYGYTESKRDKRVYFHKREDMTDKLSFVSLSELQGIDEDLSTAERERVSTPEELNASARRIAELLNATPKSSGV